MNLRIRSAIVMAAIVLLLAVFGERFQEAGLVAAGPERISGVCMAVVLVWFGNALPKNGRQSCGTGSCENFRVRRFVGITFMLAGLAHGLVWLFAPAANAAELATLPVAIGLLLAVAAFVRQRTAS